MTKMCSKCLMVKNIDDFYKNKGTAVAACKECTRKTARSYRIRTGKIKGNYGRSRFEKLIGQTINYWTVIGNITKGEKSSKVLCRCKCGVEQLVLCRRLENGEAKGCRECCPYNGSKSALFQGVGEISVTYLRKISKGAKERNIDVSVTAQELWELYLKQNGKCALTGLKIDFGKHIYGGLTKGQSQTASLDRIDSKKGYTIDNVQWLHKHVNIMKNRYDNEYFKNICKLVTEHAN